MLTNNESPNVTRLQKNDIICAIIALLFLGKILAQIMLVNQVGFTNNGDFWRNIVFFGITNVGCAVLPHDGFCPQYSIISDFIVNAPPTACVTTHLFILAAKLIYLAIDGVSGAFSIFYMGVLYTLVYALGFFYLVRKITFTNPYLKWAVIALSFILLSDLLFTSFFNTFFDEPAFIVFTLWFTVFFIFYNYATLDILLSFLIILSKQQNLIFLLLLPLICLKYRKLFNKYHLLLIIACLSFTYWNYTKNANDISCQRNFSGFFSGVLHNNTPQETAKLLAQLKLDPALAQYSNFTYWGNTVPQTLTKMIHGTALPVINRVCAQVKLPQIIQGYILQPKKIITNTLSYITNIDTHGPYTLYSYSTPANYQDHHSKSYFSAAVLKHSKTLVAWLILALGMIVAYFVVTRRRQTSEQLLTLLLFASYLSLSILSIIICFIGDGFADTIKHALEYYYLLTILVLLVIYATSKAIDERINHKETIC